MDIKDQSFHGADVEWQSASIDLWGRLELASSSRAPAYSTVIEFCESVGPLVHEEVYELRRCVVVLTTSVADLE